MEPYRTISELKSSFIRAQVRILSEKLEPPENWRRYAAETDEDDLSDKAVNDALYKLDLALKQHHRIVYSSQAIHHVARQIASLYWASVDRDIRTRDSSGKGVGKQIDLTDHSNIAGLPIQLEEQFAAEDARSRYKQLRERLADLDSQRQRRRRRLEQLRKLRRLLEPFTEPQKNIQPNLITRDGELVEELSRMRKLVIRVGARISQSQGKRKRDDDQNSSLFSLGYEQKLGSLLNMS